MTDSNPFTPSAFPYENANGLETDYIDSSMQVYPTDTPADTPEPPPAQLQQQPPGSLKRKAEGEPEGEHQQQPNKKFKFSLGASGPAPPPPASVSTNTVAPSAAPSPVPAPVAAAPQHRPASTSTAGISQALSNNDSASAREALLRELETLDQELRELDVQMAAPVAPTTPANAPRSRPRARPPGYPDGGELEELKPGHQTPQKMRPAPTPFRPTPSGTVAPSPQYVPAPGGVKRKPHEPAIPPSSEWTKYPRIPLKAAGSEAKGWEEAKTILREITSHSWAWPFKEPVDPVKLGIPTYNDIIKRPMDLGTIKVKLNKKAYPTLDDFIADMRLVWSNAMTFNAPFTDVYKMAEFLSGELERKVPRLLQLGKKDPRDDLRRLRDLHAKLEAQRNTMEEEERNLISAVQATHEITPQNYIIPTPVFGATPMSYEEKLALVTSINNLTEAQNAGLIELIKRFRPQLIHPDSMFLDLNPDTLDPEFLRQMELFIQQNGLATSSAVKMETPVSSAVGRNDSVLSPAQNSGVKMEPVDVEDKRLSESSSSDDEEPLIAAPRSFPAPTPSSDFPQFSTPSPPPQPPAQQTFKESVGSKMPKIIDNKGDEEKPSQIEVNEASWGGLADDSKGQSAPVESNPMWSEFKNRTAQQLQLEKEKEEREKELQKAHQQQQEEQRRIAQEALEKEREEKARKEQEQLEEIQRQREHARLQREQETGSVDLLEQQKVMRELQHSLNHQ